MTIDHESSPADVGLILRQLREERNMSIRELSRTSGLSANALSMIERGLSSPSVSTLYRLTDALRVPITALFRAEEEKQAIVFRTLAQRSPVPFPGGVMEGLGGESFSGRVQPFMITLEAGAASGEDKIVHSGHEFVMCLEGRLEYVVEGRQYTMEAGDSLLFAARLTHRWHNPGSVTSRALIVLSGFEEYEEPGLFHLPAEG